MPTRDRFRQAQWRLPADFPAAGAGGEGIGSVSENEELDDATGADAQDDNASAEPEAGPAADEDSE